jgi:hypothetical protein
MNTDNRTMKHITLQVQDPQCTVYQIRLTVDEAAASGTLAILTPEGTVAQQSDLLRLKKDINGTQLACTVRGATTTLVLHGDKTPPEMQVVASLFWPIFDATYRLSQEEHQRFMQWIQTLTLDLLA